MAAPDFIDTPQGRRIAYHMTAGAGPTVVFCGGFKSDMEGTKAIHLEDWAKATGRAFLRFDYSGHGQSSENFLDGCIGDWTNDAFEVVSALIPGDVVIVGSSMGGWIALNLMARFQLKIAGFVGIAAAPDFTEDSMWAGFTPEQRDELAQNEQLALPSEYSDEPYIITKKLIEDGRENLVLRTPLTLDFPTRLLQGTADEDVPVSVAMRLLEHVEGDDIRLTLVKDADHRFSTPDCLKLIEASIEEVLARC
ncbi:alpha/beta fold hydrolase [Candidatus Rhodobacter oscarellae]|nr:alpha/beta hydrolase [Candidatus Rhodobacter lobularis]